MYGEKWIAQNCASLSGRTVAVSGSTGGIGRVLCERLASLGASLILMDRSPERSTALGEALKEKYPSLSVEYITVDMSEPDSVTEATEALKQTAVDTLILNAGAYHIPRHKTALGLDNVYQINFLSPYYIAREMLPLLRERGGRVVAVGSIANGYSHIDPADRDFSTRNRASLVYGNAKRHLMYSLMELGREGGVAIAHPGITFTGITAHYPKLIFALIKHPMKVIFMKPRTACLSILAGVYGDTGECEWIGPRVFAVWGLPRRGGLRGCGAEERRVICESAEELYRLMKKRKALASAGE